MPVIAEVKHEAISETHRLELGNGFPFDHWNRSLSELETFIIEAPKHPHAEFPDRNAQLLINSVKDNTGIMIALVFNADRTKVTALPLPEVYSDNDRVAVGTNTYSCNANLEDIVRKTQVLIKNLSYIPGHIISRDIIVIQQNTGYFRADHPISVGYWDLEASHKARKVTASYEHWLEQVRREMNGERVSL